MWIGWLCPPRPLLLQTLGLLFDPPPACVLSLPLSLCCDVCVDYRRRSLLVTARCRTPFLSLLNPLRLSLGCRLPAGAQWPQAETVTGKRQTALRFGHSSRQLYRVDAA